MKTILLILSILGLYEGLVNSLKNEREKLRLRSYGHHIESASCLSIFVTLFSANVLAVLPMNMLISWNWYWVFLANIGIFIAYNMVRSMFGGRVIFQDDEILILTLIATGIGLICYFIVWIFF